jgi:2'-5' RNA ligase
LSARLFVALELPADVRAQLAEFGRASAGRDQALRPVARDALHLTLAFLGHRALDEVDPAREAVRAVAGTPAPVLALGEVLWLAPRRPHVLTVALDDADGALGALGALHAELVGGLVAALPWQPEARPFRPHVTVARVRRDWRPRMRELPEAPRARFTPEAVVLFRSHLGGGPVRYEPLERAELGARSTSSSWPPP